MLPSFMNQKLTRQRYPLRTDHGTQVIDLQGTPTEINFYGTLQPGWGMGATDVTNRNGAEITKIIWATDPNVDLNHMDIIPLAEGKFFVNGEPDRWTTGILDHAVIYLSKWTS